MSARAPVYGPGKANFTLNRFELVDGERFEVEGHWSGVRGRRFIRPELRFTDRDSSHRLLADMNQKPWQASEQAAWAVTFPGGTPVDDDVRVELTVAPDLIVTLQRGRRRRRRSTGPETPGVTSPRPIMASLPEPAAPAPPPARRGLGVQLAEAREELTQAQAEQARLTDRLDAAQHRAETAHRENVRARELYKDVIAERDAVIEDRADALAEGDRVSAERDALESERQALEAERDRMVAVHAAVAAERDELVAERDSASADAASAKRAMAEARRAAEDGVQAARRTAEQDRDQLRARLAEAGQKLDQVRLALAEAVAERDAALRAGKEIHRELEAARSERELLLRELRERRDERAPVAEPPAAPPPAPSGQLGLRSEAWQLGPARQRPSGATRLVAVAAVVLAAVIVVVVLLAAI